MKNRNLLSFTLLSFFIQPVAPAAIHEWDDSDLSIAIDRPWNCEFEAPTLVCQKQDQSIHDGGIIIATTKKRTESETLASFESFLKQPKRTLLADDTHMLSVPNETRRTVINGQTWITSTHWQSEVEGFYTLYLATTTAKESILITFTASKSRFSGFTKEVEPIIKRLSLKTKSTSKVY